VEAERLYREGKLGEAIASLQEDLRSNPHDVPGRIFLFELLLFRGDFERARKQLDVVENADPESYVGTAYQKHILRAEEKRQEQREKEAELQASGRKRRGRKPKAPSDKPESKSQRNFTDPESRIMKDGATKSFEQCYNCQAAVDQESQIVVAATVTQEPNDKQQVEPLIGELESNLGEENLPGKASADSGYFSEANVNYLQSKGIDPYIATGRQKHGEPAPAAPRGRIPANLSTRERMARKLRTKKGKAIYKERKQIVEPFFGQTKSARGFRQFLLRGLENVGAEWSLLAMTHNLLKLFRSGRAAAVLN